MDRGIRLARAAVVPGALRPLAGRARRDLPGHLHKLLGSAPSRVRAAQGRGDSRRVDVADAARSIHQPRPIRAGSRRSPPSKTRWSTTRSCTAIGETKHLRRAVGTGRDVLHVHVLVRGMPGADRAICRRRASSSRKRWAMRITSACSPRSSVRGASTSGTSRRRSPTWRSSAQPSISIAASHGAGRLDLVHLSRRSSERRIERAGGVPSLPVDTFSRWPRKPRIRPVVQKRRGAARRLRLVEVIGITFTIDPCSPPVTWLGDCSSRHHDEGIQEYRRRYCIRRRFPMDFRCHCRDHGALADCRAALSLLQYVAVDNEHGCVANHFPRRVPSTKYAEPGRTCVAAQAGRAHPGNYRRPASAHQSGRAG